MAASAPSSLFDRLRQRADALPLDRAPLRRAGVLTLLLIGLLVLGKVFSPTSRMASDRQDVRSPTEEVSAPQSSSAWTGGRVLALLLLATGGGIAFWLHRRSGGRVASHGSTLEVLETHPLGPGQSLRLVACGDEVLLLSVASEGATLLRHWPRKTFDAEPISFASALADLVDTDTPPSSGEPDPPPEVTNDLPSRSPASSTETSLDWLTASLKDNDDDVRSETIELTTSVPISVPEPSPTTARGTLFPSRTRAPHQFDVQDG